MREEPPLPQPVPEIPRGPLWYCLAIPPALTVVTNGLIASFGGTGPAIASLAIPVVIFFVICGLTQFFNDTITKRYQGRSVVFLNLAYFFGQIIVCFALWFGSCVLFFPALNLH